MGIAAYNRGSRAISRHIDQQLAEARQIKARPILSDREATDFRAIGRRVREAINSRDFTTAQAEQRAFRELTDLEPDFFRIEATRVMREAWTA